MATLSLFSRDVSSLSSAVLVSGSHPQSLCDSLALQSCTAEAARSGADALARVETKCFDMVLLEYPAARPGCRRSAAHDEVRATGLAGYPAGFRHRPPVAFRARLRSHQQLVLDSLQQGVAESCALPADVIPALEEPATVIEPMCEPLPDMIGHHAAMGQVYRLSRMVARRDATVLLEGDSGTGKELIARAIHQLSPCAKLPMITVNCAAIPESLLESELFGYVRGAFTGAVQSKLGRIHAAHGGTLFLDEIGELPLSMQAKLLRFLQEGEVQRLGSPDVFRVDIASLRQQMPT